MKTNHFLSIVALLLLPFCASAQTEINVPLEVQAAFQKEFAQSSPSWSMEYKGDGAAQMRYEATFQLSGANTMAVYDKEGNLLAVETSIKPQDLPKAAQDYLKKNFAKHSVQEAARIVGAKKLITYEVGLQSDNEFVVLQFDAKGYYLDRTP